MADDVKGTTMTPEGSAEFDRHLLVSEIKVPMVFVAQLYPRSIRVGDVLRITVDYRVAYSDDGVRGNVIGVGIEGRRAIREAA